MNDKNIYEYRYLDQDVAKRRRESLEKYANTNETDLLNVFGLSFMDETDNLKARIIKSVCKSAINPSVTLNEEQLELISILNQGKNLFLSAPTSFGKTFVVLEYIKRNVGRLNNIVFIVPTIALMNELVFKINKSFGQLFNICINEQEAIGTKNFFIFVPERSGKDFVSKINQNKVSIDLMVFDEIYKLNKCKSSRDITNDDRIIIMNKAYLKMVSISKQVVLLGPFIKDVRFERTKLNIVKYYTNFLPVINVIESKEIENWIELLKQNNHSLVFFHYPSSIYSAIEQLISEVSEDEDFVTTYKEELAYLEEKYTKDWLVIDALKRGYGIHHGKMEMFLRKFFEDEYRKGHLKGLFCTSTLMEGINTPTQSLIVMECPKTAFELNNLIGRVGRLTLGKPVIGHVYLCNEEAKRLYNGEDYNKWMSLTILAETINPINNEEALFLNKEYVEKERARQFEKTIEIIMESSGKTKEEIVETDLKYIHLKKYVEDDYSKKFNACKSVYDCASTAYMLLGRTIENFYKPSQYIDLVFPEDRTLSAILYMDKLLSGFTIKQCVKDFNENFNPTKNRNNINKFIDALNQTISYIKFNLVKTCGYLDFFGFNVAGNKSVSNFVHLLGMFSQSDLLNKILEDLGIEEADFIPIKRVLNVDTNDKISTSFVIKKIKENKESILKLRLSPFTKHNILSICD